ncbi:MAG TPA: response regulator [Spirochaetota bacterium]|nr:response regulator [Spirochaetota bacterium]
MISAKNKGCILLVDDEELVRLSSFNILKSMSYEVISAADGIEALELYSRYKEKVNLAIIDLIMPRMGGLDLFRRLRGINPSFEIILCSGLCSEETEDELLSSGVSGIIMKPYTSSELSFILEKIEMKKQEAC